MSKYDIVIIGGGPSGLSAAYECVKHGAKVLVLEQENLVGGLARTIVHGGNRYDVGPHRFFTMNQEINDLFREVCAEDLINVKRLTRIYYDQKFFDYPIKPFNAIKGLGAAKIFPIVSSYALARLGARKDIPITSFEEWAIKSFGTELYKIFFKGYTEKVWGIDCKRISSDWASQRIKGLDMVSAISNALFKKIENRPKTLVDEFMYPRLGAGQLYEKMAEKIRSAGSIVLNNVKVKSILSERGRIKSLRAEDSRGAKYFFEGDFFLSSAPLTEMAEMLSDSCPDSVLDARRKLRYRNHIGVNLEIEGKTFPDNWIYINCSIQKMARISNYKNFSNLMVAREGVSPITVEYFAFPGDGIWQLSDIKLKDLAVAEIERAGLGRRIDVRDYFVVRSQKAYPVLEIGYKQHVDVIRKWLNDWRNLMPMGRGGLFKYNNQDHAMYTGILAARTALGLGHFNPWNVNTDSTYHESGSSHL